MHKYNKEFEDFLISKKDIKDKEEKRDFDIDNNINSNYNKEIKEKSPINLIINDKFLDLLINIYQNEGAEIGFQNDNGEIYNNQNHYHCNNPYKFDEQISCICLKSKCLNNYCTCHKNGSICNKNCRCIDCENNNIK